MEYVSSDTNVWLDFLKIDRLDLPFLLPYVYVMYYESIETELLYPKGLNSKLTEKGLVGVDITEEEFFLADYYSVLYRKLSKQDRIALAIAKTRNIILLTGDGALRNAAVNESAKVIGTIGILDCLHDGKYIDDKEYMYCLVTLKQLIGKGIRLPIEELEKRIKSLELNMKANQII